MYFSQISISFIYDKFINKNIYMYTNLVWIRMNCFSKLNPKFDIIQ